MFPPAETAHNNTATITLLNVVVQIKKEIKRNLRQISKLIQQNISFISTHADMCHQSQTIIFFSSC